MAWACEKAWRDVRSVAGWARGQTAPELSWSVGMQTASGNVVDGRVELDGDVPERTSVTVIARDCDETFEADPATEKMPLGAIAQCERGETIPMKHLLSESFRIEDACVVLEGWRQGNPASRISRAFSYARNLQAGEARCLEISSPRLLFAPRLVTAFASAPAQASASEPGVSAPAEW
jgi:hypothetical protein